MRSFTLAAVFLCACVSANGGQIGGDTADVGGAGGSGGSGGDMAATTSAGGAMGPGPDDSERPSRLRKVAARDSRGLEPNTLVMAIASEPQTFWLPSAKNNDGAIVVVKEATGKARSITVITTERDVFMVDGCSEYETSTPWNSWTFVSFGDGEDGPGWLLLDAVDSQSVTCAAP